jgi:RNA polymerase sigma factor (sigma-70 family)
MEDASNHDKLLLDPLEVCEAVQAFQQAYREWEAEQRPDQREILGSQLTLRHQQLWLLVQPLLLKVTKEEVWGRMKVVMGGSPMEDLPSVHESIALSLYLDFIETLRTKQIDPSRNVLHFLELQARYRLRDQIRWYTFPGSHRLPKERPDDASQLSEESSKARMWPPYTPALAWMPDDPGEQSDPATSDMEDEVLRELQQQLIWQAARTFWNTLSPKKRLVMELRYVADPPLTLREIAQRLEEKEDAVRQRHKRVLRETIKYLRQHNLLDPEADLE